MKTDLENVIKAAEQLPETDQVELVAKIEDMIIQRKIAAGEASYEKDGGIPLDEAFDGIKARL